MTNRIRTRKGDHERAARATITLPPVLLDHATDRSKKCGFTGLSDYIQGLIRKDAGIELSA